MNTPTITRAWTTQETEDHATLNVTYSDGRQATLCRMADHRALPDPADYVGLTEYEAQSILIEDILKPAGEPFAVFEMSRD